MVALIILDGWGLAAPGPGNAVALARTPRMDRILATCPHARLAASGGDVGLPDGQMGNSEVGHMNLGAGRVVLQTLTRIHRAVADGSFFENAALRATCALVAAQTGADRAPGPDSGAPRLHLVGLCSEGGVHSALSHLVALLRLARRAGVGDVCVHAVTDGRDTAPGTAAAYLDQVARAMAEIGVGRLATVMGRYYAMDRDQRWERTEQAYRALCGEGPRALDHRAALALAAGRTAPNGRGPETDEFITPTVIGTEGTLRAGDAVIFFNFRADRARQLTLALAAPAFAPFARALGGPVRHFCGMCDYGVIPGQHFAFPGLDAGVPLGEVISRAGLRQLRLAETEKYAHVTYFFNGGVEAPYPGEERALVPSPRVATYDLCPEMSAAGIAERATAAIVAGEHALLVVNFANPDMVGHTGSLPAAIAACEAADTGLGRLLDALERSGGGALVVADHGNAEVMRDPDTGLPHTAHTTNPVPCVLVGHARGARLRDGRLADVAPTLLQWMGLPQPAEMDGRSLLAAPAPLA